MEQETRKQGRIIIERSAGRWDTLIEKLQTLPDNGLRDQLCQLFERMKSLNCFEPAIGPGRGRNANKFYVEWPEHGIIFTISYTCREGKDLFAVEMLQIFLPTLKTMRFVGSDMEKFPFHALPQNEDEVRFYKINKHQTDFSFLLVSFRASLYYNTISNQTNCLVDFLRSELALGCFVYALESDGEHSIHEIPNVLNTEYEKCHEWRKILLPQSIIQLKGGDDSVELHFICKSARFKHLESVFGQTQ